MNVLIRTSRDSIVRNLIRETRPSPLPADLFREQAWSTSPGAMVEYEAEIPFSFNVVGVGEVELCTTTLAHTAGFTLVFHKMGSNHRLKAKQWRTATFHCALYQCSSENPVGKRMQMLRLSDKQLPHKKGSKRQIDFELVGEPQDYDDISR